MAKDNYFLNSQCIQSVYKVYFLTNSQSLHLKSKNLIYHK